MTLTKTKPRTKLVDFLTPEQKRTFKEHNYFDVVASSGRTYRIRTNSYTGNVVRLNAAGGVANSYCAHTFAPHLSRLDLEDCWLTQMLTIRTDVARFLRVAL